MPVAGGFGGRFVHPDSRHLRQRPPLVRPCQRISTRIAPEQASSGAISCTCTISRSLSGEMTFAAMHFAWVASVASRLRIITTMGFPGRGVEKGFFLTSLSQDECNQGVSPIDKAERRNFISEPQVARPKELSVDNRAHLPSQDGSGRSHHSPRNWPLAQ